MQSHSIRENIERLFLKSIRSYTFNTPLAKGKYRLYQTALNFCRFPPTHVETTVADGRRYAVDLTTRMHETVYFIGEYEPAVTSVISSVVKTGDVCLDVGANFGWFTILLHRLCGGENQSLTKTGKVHAFEPMPAVYNTLQENWKLAGEPENVFLNNLALGDDHKAVDFYRFTNLPDGFSSLSAEMDKENVEVYSVQMTALNSYLTDKKVGDVNFIKLDVEGAELMFLKGATQLFSQKIPPIIMAEMALDTTKNFGYLPDDLIKFIQRHADYDFYALVEDDCSLHPIEGFAPEQIGANVLCVPANCEPARLKNLHIIE